MMKCVICNVNDIFTKNNCKKCYMKEYYKQNKDRIDQKNYSNTKKYYESDKGIKNRRIKNWKTSGLIDIDNDNYEKIYQRYMDTTNCDLCNVLLTEHKNGNAKEMEHDHTTQLFRNVVCRRCNIKIKVIETPCRSNTGIKNITFTNHYYKYNKTAKGVKTLKYFKQLDDAICYSVINDMIIKLENDN